MKRIIKKIILKVQTEICRRKMVELNVQYRVITDLLIWEIDKGDREEVIQVLKLTRDSIMDEQNKLVDKRSQLRTKMIMAGL